MSFGTVVAVDLGATSGRVFVVRLNKGMLSVKEIRRFANIPVTHDDGSLRWDWPLLVAEVRKGLDAAMGRELVSSIGIDAWGVDYGLVGESGDLVTLPYSYRDDRTAAWRKVIDQLGPQRVYGITGTQLMPINTLIQLALQDRDELGRARWILLVPELMVKSLTGVVSGEHTSASTTQMYDGRSRSWSRELCEEIGVPVDMLPRIERAGTHVGEYIGVPVVLVGGHDTASAVAALPLSNGRPSAYLSSGTWSLVGIELDEPELTDEAFKLNFTNEAGVFGSVRFLKNVMGLWMLDQCLREWGVQVDDAVREASRVPSGPRIDATEERFLNPPSMERAIREATSGLGHERSHVVRCVLDSLAFAYSGVLGEIEQVIGRGPEVLHIIGGGSRLDLLNRLTAEACGLPVVAGPIEATAIGNGLVQMIAHGWVSGIEEARELVRRSFELRPF